MTDIKATDVREASYRRTDILVIDPCYVIRDNDDWDDVCAQISKCGTLHYRGRKVLYTQTKWGDGEYTVRLRDGSEIGTALVDSGLLSVWRLHDALSVNPDLNTELGASEMPFSGRVVVNGDDGAIEGDLQCITAEDEDDDDEEDE